MSLKVEALHTDAPLSTVLFNDVLNIQLLQYFKSSRLYYCYIHLELGRDWFELCFFYWEVCLSNKCWLKTLGLMKDDGCVRPYSSVLKTVFKHTHNMYWGTRIHGMFAPVRSVRSKIWFRWNPNATEKQHQSFNVIHITVERLRIFFDQLWTRSSNCDLKPNLLKTQAFK